MLVKYKFLNYHENKKMIQIYQYMSALIIAKWYCEIKSNDNKNQEILLEVVQNEMYGYSQNTSTDR